MEYMLAKQHLGGELCRCVKIGGLGTELMEKLSSAIGGLHWFTQVHIRSMSLLRLMELEVQVFKGLGFNFEIVHWERDSRCGFICPGSAADRARIASAAAKASAQEALDKADGAKVVAAAAAAGMASKALRLALQSEVTSGDTEKAA